MVAVAARPCCRICVWPLNRETLHDGDERFLGCASAVGLRAGDPAAERVDAVVVAAQERFHRGAIAGLRRGHELAVVGDSRDGRTVASRRFKRRVRPKRDGAVGVLDQAAFAAQVMDPPACEEEPCSDGEHEPDGGAHREVTKFVIGSGHRARSPSPRVGTCPTRDALHLQRHRRVRGVERDDLRGAIGEVQLRARHEDVYLQRGRRGAANRQLNAQFREVRVTDCRCGRVVGTMFAG